jgi:hypothetical protein
MKRSRWLAVACLVSLGLTTPVWALQKTVKAKLYNHKKAPVILKESKVTLVETFSAPTQVAAQDASVTRSRIKYANRKGMMPSSFVLKGELVCQNQSEQQVEAVALAIVLLDPFHQPIQLPGQASVGAPHQVVLQLPEGTSKPITWEQVLKSADLFEVAVVVTRVRFQDGSVWMAPSEEITDIF